MALYRQGAAEKNAQSPMVLSLVLGWSKWLELVEQFFQVGGALPYMHWWVSRETLYSVLAEKRKFLLHYFEVWQYFCVTISGPDTGYQPKSLQFWNHIAARNCDSSIPLPPPDRQWVSIGRWLMMIVIKRGLFSNRLCVISIEMKFDSLAMDDMAKWEHV